jgi:hypothetical protein
MDLKVIEPTGRFAEAHPHVIYTFENVQRIIREIALGLTSWHPRDALTHAAGVQEAIDKASSELSLVRERWDEIDGEISFEDTNQSRIESLTGTCAAGEVQTLGDLTAIGFGDFGKFMARGPEGYKYFSDLLRTPLEDMPNEVPPVLYVLALLVNNFDDPAGIRRRASLFLDVLHEAYAESGEALLDTAVRVQDSLGEAGAMLTYVGPLIETLLRTPGVPEDALRTFLLNTYKDLTEGCFRHVANLFLFAMFVNKESPKSWESVADWASFGDKYHWLKNCRDDPPIAAAL